MLTAAPRMTALMQFPLVENVGVVQRFRILLVARVAQKFVNCSRQVPCSMQPRNERGRDSDEDQHDNRRPDEPVLHSVNGPVVALAISRQPCRRP
jgi:hypothetical protein